MCILFNICNVYFVKIHFNYFLLNFIHTIYIQSMCIFIFIKVYIKTNYFLIVINSRILKLHFFFDPWQHALLGVWGVAIGTVKICILLCGAKIRHQ